MAHPLKVSLAAIGAALALSMAAPPPAAAVDQPSTTPTPTPTATPAAESPAATVDGDRPVARVKGRMVVRAKTPKKNPKKEELIGPVEDKEWLREVCPVGVDQGGTWLDRSQDRLGWGVCRATLWFDGLFGNERAILERDATYGYVHPRLSWDEVDGVDPDVRIRAKINLPLADRRFNALLGRDVSRTSTRESTGGSGGEQLPESFSDADEQWLVGLGYSPVRGNRRRLDFDAGVELDTPVEFFTQGRLRRHWFVSQRDLVRLRQSVFWRSDDGFGTRLDLDYERALRGPYVVRWRNVGTYAQHIEGVEWFEELTLFHRLGDRHALAYLLHADGETGAAVTLDEYGLDVVYRRNILRDWLFVELRPGVAWKRPEVERRREATPVLGVGLEIQFGDRDFE